jgi:seryl-tRNA synthetase
VKQKSHVKSGEEMTGKDMLCLKRKMEKRVKALKNKLKKDLQKERAKQRREMRNTKARCTQENIAARAYTDQFVDQLTTAIADLAESSTEENVITRAHTDHLRHLLNIKITNLAVEWNEAMQHEIRRHREQTSSVRRLQQDFRHFVSSIRP